MADVIAYNKDERFAIQMDDAAKHTIGMMAATIWSAGKAPSIDQCIADATELYEKATIALATIKGA